MKALLLAFVVVLAGCASHPALRGALIGVSVAVVAGSSSSHHDTPPRVRINPPNCAGGACQ